MDKAHAKLRGSFRSGVTRPLEFRLSQIKAIRQFLWDHRDQLLDASVADGKCRSEALVSDILATVRECQTFESLLAGWMRPVKSPVDWTMTMTLDAAHIQPEPLGCVMVIGTWNYPIATLIGPVIGALGAGNCVLMKLSEVSENVSRYLAKHLPQYLDSSCVQFVEGAVVETTHLLSLKWDHIFYTGNGTVGRVIARAAAEHLTTCTLELGGKSPTIIDLGVDMRTTAKRVAYGKFFNVGQTCIATDYLFVHKSVHDEFIEHLRDAIKASYGEDFQKSQHLGRIVNERHWTRLTDMLKKTNGIVVIGGQSDKATKYIAPTVVTGIKPTDSLMKSEIFGPIMPVMTYENLEEVVNFIESRDKPLACYLFSNSAANIDQLQNNVTAGGFVINDTIMQFVTHGLPFGGVGESGYGSYHGYASFTAFSHMKPVLHRSNMLETPNLIRYPPYTDRNLGLMTFALVGTADKKSDKAPR